MRIGFVGWRGMVGSVLMYRFKEENDFQHFGKDFIFFSTSNVGGTAPNFGQEDKKLHDAYNIDELKELDIIVTCQGGDYTNKIHSQLRNINWNGFWVDAASSLRMKDNSIIVLDPLNKNQIKSAIANDVKDYIGGNCTVSLLLLGLAGLLRNNLIEWVSSMTYQAASGAGAANMRELIKGMGSIYNEVASDLDDKTLSILDIDKKVADFIRSDIFPKDNFQVPLAGSLIPWIDKDLGDGQSREEWKGEVELNKILNLKESNYIPVDGICVRIGVMRCHSQALTIKLKKDISVEEISSILANDNQWTKVIDNNKEDSIKYLTPTYVSGTLNIPIGRIRKMSVGKSYIRAFTVGDQLLWGAAEPLRRVLLMILGVNLD